MAQWKDFGSRVGKPGDVVCGYRPARRGRRGRRGGKGLPARVEELEARRLLAGGTSTLGKEFWLAFTMPLNEKPPDVQRKSLYFSSKQQAQVTVDIPGMGWTKSYTVNPGVVSSVLLPVDACADSSDGISEVAIHVTSDQDISAHGLNYELASTDGYTALPVPLLGQDYMAIAYTPAVNVPYDRVASQIAVVATEDGTNVTITPSVNAGTRPAGVPYVVTLSRGQVYQLQSRGYGSSYDLTGSSIRADRPVAVFSGNTGTFLPIRTEPDGTTYMWSDHLEEQLIPIGLWGDHFVTVPLAGRVNGDTFRVMAGSDGTEVAINGNIAATLSAGEYYEWIGVKPQEIRASKPVTLAQYANSAQFEGEGNRKGDPFMAIIPPVELSLMDYTMRTPEAAYANHYINVWTEKGTTVVVDGQEIPDSEFRVVGRSDYVFATIEVYTNPLNHTVRGSAPVGMMLYGWGECESYGLVGGQIFPPDPPVADLNLEPPTSERIVGQSQQVTAVAMDDAGQPVTGAWVYFTVEGANPMSGLVSGYAPTDANGRVSFAYTGTEFGLDSVTAHTIDDTSNASIVKWHSVPVANAQTITVLHDTMYSGAVGAVSDDGDSLIYTQSTPPEHGELVFQADGSFTYMPDAGYTGLDHFAFWANDWMAMSEVARVDIIVLPPNRPPDIADQTLYVAEHVVIYAPAGVVEAHDPDNHPLTFAILDGDPNGVFAIRAETGLIQVMRPEYLDYEMMPGRYDLRIQVTDNGVPSLSNQATVTIIVLDIDESMTGFTLSSTSIPEHRPAGTVVGDLLASNPERQSSMVYTLVGGPGSSDNATFNIVDQKLVANPSFDYEVRHDYRVRIRGTDGMTVFIEKAFAINVTNINEAPAAIELSRQSVPEDQVPGTLVGHLSASSDIPDDSFTFSLVAGEGSESNGFFRINGDRLETADALDFVPGREYAVRVGVRNFYGLSVARKFTIQVTVLPEFGKVEKKTKSLNIVDTDGDVATFRLSGGGLGAVNGSEVSLIGTTAKSVMTISVKKGKSGDGLFHVTGLAADGLLKGINGSAAVLSGLMQINCLNQSPGKAAVSMKLRQMSEAEVYVRNLPVSSIAVAGGITGSRISTTGSVGKISAAEVRDSDILVGVDWRFDGQFAGVAGDFANAAAKLGSLTVKGKKVPKGSSHPAYVSAVHVSAPSIGMMKLTNVDSTAGAVQMHVLADTGTVAITALKPVMEGVAVLPAGSWKPGAEGRPDVFEVV